MRFHPNWVWSMLLLTACPESEDMSPSPVPAAEPVQFVRTRTQYCELEIDDTGYGACGLANVGFDFGQFRGFFYDPEHAYSADEVLVQTSASLHFEQLVDDVAELSVSYSAESTETYPPFDFRVEGRMYVPWTQFLSKEYPHGDEPYYYVFGTMWVHFMGYERVSAIDDVEDYPEPEGGFTFCAEVAIDHDGL